AVGAFILRSVRAALSARSEASAAKMAHRRTGDAGLRASPKSQISGVNLVSRHVGCWRAVAGRGVDMTAVHHPTDFICPGCGADYKVVRVKAEADPPHRLIHCKVCKRSLAPHRQRIHFEILPDYPQTGSEIARLA